MTAKVLLACLPRASLATRTAAASLARPFSSTLPLDTAASSEPSPPHSRRRKRPSFDNLDEIPSFQVFQQRTQVRSLYRQYLRTIAPLDVTQRHELLGQIQVEFRKIPAKPSNDASKSHWEVQRALSEGTRRLKELGSMLGTVVKSKSPSTKETEQLTSTTVPENPWPWQR
jgi:hypothetical protein